MKRQLYGTADLMHAGLDQEVLVEYYVTELEKDDEGFDEEPFGIEVIKKQKIDGIVYHEVKRVAHLGGDIASVVQVLELLYRNCVTPVCVADVLDDLLAVH